MQMLFKKISKACAWNVEDIVGFIPSFLSANDPRPVSEQLNDNYSHGGGWRHFDGFTLDGEKRLKYPGDPPMEPLAKAELREETILVYQSGWVVILQPDGKWECCRID